LGNTSTFRLIDLKPPVYRLQTRDCQHVSIRHADQTHGWRSDVGEVALLDPIAFPGLPS